MLFLPATSALNVVACLSFSALGQVDLIGSLKEGLDGLSPLLAQKQIRVVTDFPAGPGIRPENLARVFDLHFTTTGLFSESGFPEWGPMNSTQRY
jgi:hypothetical protein